VGVLIGGGGVVLVTEVVVAVNVIVVFCYTYLKLLLPDQFF